MEEEKSRLYIVELKDKKDYWMKLRIIGISLWIFPLILLLTGYFFKKNGFTGVVKSYEEGAFRFIQYIFFFSGIGIVFFCDSISNFFAKIFFSSIEKGNKNEGKLARGYSSYTIILMAFFNFIGSCGFIGFSICGNFTWLVIFIVLNFSLLFRYFPSYERFSNLISQINLSKENQK